MINTFLNPQRNSCMIYPRWAQSLFYVVHKELGLLRKQDVWICYTMLSKIHRSSDVLVNIGIKSMYFIFLCLCYHVYQSCPNYHGKVSHGTHSAAFNFRLVAFALDSKLLLILLISCVCKIQASWELNFNPVRNSGLIHFLLDEFWCSCAGKWKRAEESLD